MLAGVERPVRADPIDGNERAVEDQVGTARRAGLAQRPAQLRGPGRQQGHRLGDIPLGRGGADAEPGRQASKLVLPPPGSHVIQDYAIRSGKARVTAAVRLETFSLP